MVFSIEYDLFLSILYKFLLTKSTHTQPQRESTAIEINLLMISLLKMQQIKFRIRVRGLRLGWTTLGLRYYFSSLSFVGICLLTAV